MKFTNIFKLLSILVITIGLFIGYGCNATKKATANDSDDLELGSFKIEKSGAVLWGENCGNCHNAPDPTSFTDKQWETVKLHMHMRAGITNDQVNKITAFLQ